MRYFLIDLFGSDLELEIEEERFLELKKSRKALTKALDLETNYEILLTGFEELEKEILSLTVSFMLGKMIDYTDSFKVRLALNIKVLNLLTAVRSYLDQLVPCIESCVPTMESGAVKELVGKLCSKEYDHNPEYRFMEALRNHVQHYGLPVHSTSRGRRWTELGPDGYTEKTLLEYSLDLVSMKSRLGENVKFKKEVISEIPDKVDLKDASRSYVESISQVHEGARQAIRDSVTNSRKVIEAAIEERSGSTVGLYAYCLDGDSEIEKIPLFLMHDDIRVKLQRRNRQLVNLKKRRVTSS